MTETAFFEPQTLPPGQISKLRQLAALRLDRDVFNYLSTGIPDLGTGSEDIMVFASGLREASRKLTEYKEIGKSEDDISKLIEFVFSLLSKIDLPKRVSGTPEMKEYVAAAAAWYGAIHNTAFIHRFWTAMSELLERDLSAMPPLRAQIFGEIADIGRQVTLPPNIDAIVLASGRRPYIFEDLHAYMKVVRYTLHRKVASGDLSGIINDWLPLWRRSFGAVRVVGRKQGRAVIDLKNDIHTIFSFWVRWSGILLGRYGGRNASAILFLIKIDYALFVRTGVSQQWLGRLWAWALRRLFRLVGGRTGVHDSNDLLPERLTDESKRRGLVLLSEPWLQGTQRDALVTRVHGGLGDIIMMRPGLLELARRRRRKGGRVFFATNRSFFHVFSQDDPICLVDIESTEIDVGSFGFWANLTEGPEADVELREIPRVRTNRIDIFARAFGVRFLPFSSKRVCPMVFPMSSNASAGKLLAMGRTPGLPNIGIQLRSAETYRDAPALIDVARRLAADFNVFVFDNRPVPKVESDEFIAIDDQPLPVMIALVGKLDLLVAPDSFFFHVAGANGVPCLALFGPTGGKVRTRAYPSVRYMDARDSLGCVPCWRNEFTTCRLTGAYRSICMSLLSAPMIADAARETLTSRS